MKPDIKIAAAQTAQALAQEGASLQQPPYFTPPEEAGPLEKSILHAHKVLASSLAQIERLRQSGKPFSYSEVLGGTQFTERVAALVYLITRKLLHIASNPEMTRDVVDERRDVSQLVEILVQVSAADALGILYDFAQAQAEKSKDPTFWQKAGQYYLHLMANMSLASGAVVAFLKERRSARQQVEQLMSHSDANTAAIFRALGEEYVKQRAGIIGDTLPAPADYVAQYRRYSQADPDAYTIALPALLTAQERIQQAVAARDFEGLAKWFLEGSPDAVRSAIQAARQALPALAYVNLLATVLDNEGAPPVRMAVAVLEMGRVNRKQQANGGDPNIDRLLMDMALTDSGARGGVAQLAVQELGRVDNFNEVLTIVERAPLVEVAEAGIVILRDMRRLPLVEQIVEQRPILDTAYAKARRHLQEIQNLLDATWACQNEYMARPYIERLRELNATRELEILGQKHKSLGDLAVRTLTELQLERAKADAED